LGREITIEQGKESGTHRDDQWQDRVDRRASLPIDALTSNVSRGR
jgi:hypothetical protein